MNSTPTNGTPSTIFPAVQRGDVVKTEIPHGKPSGMTGFVMNTRKAPFDDWRVREALLLAFNFEYINDTITGGAQPRITSYFSGSDLAYAARPQPPAALPSCCRPYADDLPPGALEGYALPQGDGSRPQPIQYPQGEQDYWPRRAGPFRTACCAIPERQDRSISPSCLQQGDTESQTAIEIYTRALERLGIQVNVRTVWTAPNSPAAMH